MSSSGDKIAIIQRYLKPGKPASISEISRDTGLSRPTIRKIIKENFPDHYIQTLKSNVKASGPKIEVEIGSGEDPQDAISFWKDQGYRYFGLVDDAKSKILLFARAK